MFRFSIILFQIFFKLGVFQEVFSESISDNFFWKMVIFFVGSLLQAAVEKFTGKWLTVMHWQLQSLGKETTLFVVLCSHRTIECKHSYESVWHMPDFLFFFRGMHTRKPRIFRTRNLNQPGTGGRSAEQHSRLVMRIVSSRLATIRARHRVKNTSNRKRNKICKQRT